MSHYPSEIAVLSGDFVASRDLDAAGINHAMDVLAGYVAQNAWLGRSFTRQRGDGWQMVVPQPRFALRAALVMRACLRTLGAGYETYVFIQAGIVDAAPPDNLNESNDEVFILSGRGLDLVKAQAKDGGVLIGHHQVGPVASACVLADHISQRWTPVQAEAMAIYLNPELSSRSYTEAAKDLGKSRQALTKSLAAAGKDALTTSLSLLESQPT